MSDRTIRVLLVAGWLVLISGLGFYLVMMGVAINQEKMKPFAIGVAYLAVAAVVVQCVCYSLNSLHRYRNETVEEVLDTFARGAWAILLVSGFVLLRHYN